MPSVLGSFVGRPACAGRRQTSSHFCEQSSTHGFGSTLEQYTVMTCGTRKRGRPQDGPFKHDTNKGYVEFKKGHYHDGIYVKKNNLVLALVVCVCVFPFFFT